MEHHAIQETHHVHTIKETESDDTGFQFTLGWNWKTTTTHHVSVDEKRFQSVKQKVDARDKVATAGPGPMP